MVIIMENYEHKYKEALERARSYYNNEEAKVGMTPIDLEEIFPELAESEDERIRKWLISQLNIKSNGTDSDLDIMIDKAIAWLEKQGEKDNWAEELNTKIKELHKQCLAKIQEYVTPCLGKMSEEDERIRKEIINLINDLWKEKQGLMTDRKDYERYIDWLEKQGEQILANSAQTCKIENYQEEGWYSSGDDEYIYGIIFDEPIKLPAEFYYKKKEANNEQAI